MSQKLEIQRHLSKGHKLTPLQALHKFGVMALSQRVGELKREGWPVATELVQVGSKRVAEYSIPRARCRR